MLKRQGVIETWHDRRIGAGQDIHHTIDEHINTDDIILLLVSPDFLASDYCYDIEMTRAMQRHETREAIVIPVILRACDWHHAPFGKLNAVPRDGKPITSWPDRDEAFLQVAKAIREAATRRVGGRTSPTPVYVSTTPAAAASAAAPPEPRSSNLRLARSFTQRDKDQFRLDTLEYIARFFENSLKELGERNAGIEGGFRRVDANRFFATIYRDGKDIARGTVYLSGSEGFGRGICYIQGETTASNSMNESINVDSDDQTLYLKATGLASLGQNRDRKLTQEGAAELLWDILIQPLQSGRH